jgi:methionyl-tRNA formyltransferase
LSGGDLCFFLSYGKVVGNETLGKYRNNLVVHESDLPSGKGWSPLTWQILQGKNRIPAVLMEAVEKVDSGPIYAKSWMEFSGGELVDELRQKQAEATIKLCRKFVDDYPASTKEGIPQQGEENFFPRRRPKDSELDPEKSLAAQFNLLRVADPLNYPAFFRHSGQSYKVHVHKKP